MGFSKWMRFFQDRRKIYELLVGLGLLFLLLLPAAARTFDSFENLFLDFRFQLRGQKPFKSPIAIIGIDETSLDVLGRWPWRRDVHARLIDLLRHESFQPAVLGWDLLFENKNTAELAGDEALVFQAQNLPSGIVMAYFFEKGAKAVFEMPVARKKRLEEFSLPVVAGDLPENLDEADRVSLPFPALSDITKLAFVNTPVDPDGRTRKAQLLMRYEGRVYPSMDLLLALDYLKASVHDVQVRRRSIFVRRKDGKSIVIPVNAKGEMLINYYGSADKVIPSYSFVEVLKRGKDWMEGKDAGILKAMKGKIVVVGVSALGLGDRRATPFHQYETGISLHAQAVANILENDFLVRLPVRTSCLALAAVGILTILLTACFTITVSLPGVILLAFSYFLLAQALFLQGLWMDVASGLLSLAVLFTGIVSFRYFTALEELKRAQAQIIQSAKMAAMGELSAGIVHEFRNILNAISLNMEVVMQPNLSEERRARYSEIFRKIMENATLVLEGLLTFARKSESVKKPGSLKKAVEDTLLLVEKEMMRHQIEVTSELEEVPPLAFDKGQVSQVVMNLMNNARDALRERESKLVHLKLIDEKTTGFVRLDIADNGTGIPPHVLKKLFQPFVTSKPAGKGTGLGLSVCHGIIRNHGGDIKVTTAQGKGTTWHIHLPKS